MESVELLQLYTKHPGTPILNELMIFAAERIVYLVPLVLLYLWFTGKEQSDTGTTLSIPWVTTEKGKSKSIFIVLTIGVSLAISYAMGLFYSHPAPYMVGYETLLVDTPENSFPSQHTTVMFAFALPVYYVQEQQRFGITALALALLVGISRVYVGVHFPLDIGGAVGASLFGFTLVYTARSLVKDLATQCIYIENRLVTLLN